MADPINYSGVSYDTSYYKTPDETMYDYMQRLAAQRAQGVLGGGGMLDTPTEEITSAPLGEVTQNCPAGYELRNGACVRVSSGGNYEDMPESKPVVRTAGNNFGLASDTAKTIAAMLPGPLGLLAGAGIAYNDSQAIKAAQEAAGIPEDQRSSSWFKGTEDSIGERSFNDRDYHISIGGMATDPSNNIIENMFGMGNMITTLTPAEAMKRQYFANRPTTVNYLKPTAGMFKGAVTTGPDAINPTSDNWETVSSPSSPTGSVSVYTPSSWSPSDITSTPSTSSGTPDWYSAATGETWD